MNQPTKPDPAAPQATPSADQDETPKRSVGGSGSRAAQPRPDDVSEETEDQFIEGPSGDEIQTTS